MEYYYVYILCTHVQTGHYTIYITILFGVGLGGGLSAGTGLGGGLGSNLGGVKLGTGGLGSYTVYSRQNSHKNYYVMIIYLQAVQVG